MDTLTDIERKISHAAKAVEAWGLEVKEEAKLNRFQPLYEAEKIDRIDGTTEAVKVEMLKHFQIDLKEIHAWIVRDIERHLSKYEDMLQRLQAHQEEKLNAMLKDMETKQEGGKKDGI